MKHFDSAQEHSYRLPSIFSLDNGSILKVLSKWLLNEHLNDQFITLSSIPHTLLLALCDKFGALWRQHLQVATDSSYERSLPGSCIVYSMLWHLAATIILLMHNTTTGQLSKLLIKSSFRVRFFEVHTAMKKKAISFRGPLPQLLPMLLRLFYFLIILIVITSGPCVCLLIVF